MRKLKFLPIVIVSVLVLVSCGKKLTENDIETIRLGMTKDEVTEKLGKETKIYETQDDVEGALNSYSHSLANLLKMEYIEKNTKQEIDEAYEYNNQNRNVKILDFDYLNTDKNDDTKSIIFLDDKVIATYPVEVK